MSPESWQPASQGGKTLHLDNDNDNDNDNDTLREVPHLSDEGLALQAKHSTLRMRNLVCGEAFQQDLERIQVGTAGIHVDEHQAVCMRAIQELTQKHFGRQ